MIDYALLLGEALGQSKLVRLSIDSLALFLDTDQWITARRNWLNDGDAPDNTAWDLIEALTAKALGEIMADNLLIGTLFPLITDSIPEGALECDGTAYARTDYPVLYDRVASVFIIDADNFAVPDLRGRTVIAAGAGAGLSTYAVGDALGEESHRLLTAEMPVHNHTVVDPGHLHTEGIAIPSPLGVTGGLPSAIPGVGVTSIATTGISLVAAGNDQYHENRQPSYALRYAVWAK